MSYKWIKIQTHVHTQNSDGSHTLMDMAKAAGENSIDVIFLTDHNTMYGYREVERITRETGVKIIKGIEYTTFYGHIITIGAPYFRWENIKVNSLNQLADHVHSHNGIIGIAHPMVIGDPVCTGGRYNFINTDFSKIDFMEEWHGVSNKHNEWEKNKKFWEDKANRGNILTALYGGDLHRKEHFKKCNAFNWVFIDESEEIEKGIIKAISCGRVVMSKGPRLHIKVKKEEHIYYMGETMEIKENEKLKVILEVNQGKDLDETNVYLVDNLGKRIELDLKDKFTEICGNKYLRWIRVEMLNDKGKDPLAKSNPIYFEFI